MEEADVVVTVGAALEAAWTTLNPYVVVSSLVWLKAMETLPVPVLYADPVSA
jgi:hypothetical protein